MLVGILTSANIDKQSIKLQVFKKKKKQFLQVINKKILKMTGMYLGDTVTVETEKDENGRIILLNIKKVA